MRGCTTIILLCFAATILGAPHDTRTQNDTAQPDTTPQTSPDAPNTTTTTTGSFPLSGENTTEGNETSTFSNTISSITEKFEASYIYPLFGLVKRMTELQTLGPTESPTSNVTLEDLVVDDAESLLNESRIQYIDAIESNGDQQNETLKVTTHLPVMNESILEDTTVILKSMDDQAGNESFIETDRLPDNSSVTDGNFTESTLEDDNEELLNETEKAEIQSLGAENVLIDTILYDGKDLTTTTILVDNGTDTTEAETSTNGETPPTTDSISTREEEDTSTQTSRDDTDSDVDYNATVVNATATKDEVETTSSMISPTAADKEEELEIPDNRNETENMKLTDPPEITTVRNTETIDYNNATILLETDTSTADATTATNKDIITTVEVEVTELTTASTTARIETESTKIPSATSTSSEAPTTSISSSSNISSPDDKYLSGTNKDLVSAVQFLHYHDKESSEQCYKLVTAHWNYATNLTEENKRNQIIQTLEYSKFYKAAWKNATSYAWKSFNDTILQRWFKSLSVLGTAALSEQQLNEFNRLKAEMKSVYSTAKVCDYDPETSVKEDDKQCTLALEPDLQRILTRSRDYHQLTHIWKKWRDNAGKPIKEKYLRFVELSNQAAVLNGFKDTGDMWRESYESKTFLNDLEELWNQLRPLYEHLHAYVRRKLIHQYGEHRIKKDGPIPAHLFGNMWAQSWVSLMDLVQPFPGKPSVDVTSTMEAKNMTATEMFKIAEEFFTSLGLTAMPPDFWKHSIIEKPKDREILCHASAWDFCNGRDYRIKQCTDITMEDLVTVHHEMGHIQYFLQYARQPNVFREGANPGFHEAIGDVLALSVSTPKHLQSIGLLDEVAEDPEGDLNFLMRAALEKVSFLPSGYLIDLWRWGLFSGEIAPEEMNTMWWQLRTKYQGICPPVKRTESDFDPGAKYHIPGNVPYIRYFVSFVIQFQFHKVLCDAAGHTGPLYKCDIYRSKEAGQILSQVMELGSSEHWSEAMKIMTGGVTSKMDVQPILEYFQPLLDYLKEQNKNEIIGWSSTDPTICP